MSTATLVITTATELTADQASEIISAVRAVIGPEGGLALMVPKESE